jgi:hypothetical protein
MQRQQIEMHQREINFLADEMDDVAGLPRSGGRYVLPVRAQLDTEVNLNNIRINNSVVGTVNTGTIGSVDNAVTVLRDSGQFDMAAAMVALVQAVTGNAAIQVAEQREAIEILSTLFEEATTPSNQRKPAVIKTLAGRLQTILSTTADLTCLWAQYGPVIHAALGI